MLKSKKIDNLNEGKIILTCSNQGCMKSFRVDITDCNIYKNCPICKTGNLIVTGIGRRTPRARNQFK